MFQIQSTRLTAIFLIFFTSLLTSLLLINPASAENFKIDIEGTHAFVQFKASHLGFSYVIGRFNDFEGAFSYDENNPQAATVNVVIAANSVDSNHAERDKHLRGEDFFAVDTYPTITFTSTAFEETDDGAIVITGELALHGVTKSVQLHGRHIGDGDDPWGGYRRGFEAGINLDSTEFGFPQWVGEVEIALIVEGIRI